MLDADTRHDNPVLQDKLNHIFTLRRAGRIDLTIRPEYFTLLDRLGNPHRKLPPVIHVAGTNGKGSTIAFMRAILEAAGYNVHVYTSPHLIRFNERIVLGGKEIDDAYLDQLLDRVMMANQNMPQTFFEITTALAFTAFAETPGDILLLETGLGGRLDSTNVVDHPLATAITTISRDHTGFLGDTIAAIAGEKSGIMKPGCPVITGHQIFSEAEETFRRHAKEKGAILSTECDSPGMDPMPTPSLVGAHQMWNASLAVAVLKTQKRFTIPEGAFHHGLTHAVWPGRLQKIDHPGLPPGWEIWFDGGHNDSGGMILAQQARNWAAQDGKPLHIITAMAQHKDPIPFAAALASHAAKVTCIGLENGWDPAELAKIWQGRGVQNVGVGGQNFDQLIEKIGKSSDSGHILLTGSLYLARHVL